MRRVLADVLAVPAKDHRRSYKHHQYRRGLRLRRGGHVRVTVRPQDFDGSHGAGGDGQIDVDSSIVKMVTEASTMISVGIQVVSISVDIEAVIGIRHIPGKGDAGEKVVGPGDGQGNGDFAGGGIGYIHVFESSF